MKKRDLIVTIVFFLVIAIIPIGTLIQLKTGTGKVVTTEEELKVLEINGTLENKDITAEDNQKKDDREEFIFPSEKVDFSDMKLSLIDKWVIAFTDFQFYTDYFVDKMFLDDKFIWVNSNMSYFLSGGKYIESNKVLVGNNDYLFYKDKVDGDPIADYKGTSLFTDESIIHVTNDLMELEQELNARGADLYVLVYPNKEQIYSQYMPDTIYRNSIYSPGKQLYDFLTQYTNIKMIYPYDALLEASEKYPVFYKADTHANRIGAFVAFQEFMKARYGECQSIDDMDVTVKYEGFSGDLAVLTKVNDTKERDTVYLVEGQDPNMWKDETILLVGDSFTGYLSNIAEMYYPRVHRIDSILFTMEYVDILQPDVVIYEAGERRIEYFESEDLYQK